MELKDKERVDKMAGCDARDSYVVGDVVFIKHPNIDLMLPAQIIEVERGKTQRPSKRVKVKLYHPKEVIVCIKDEIQPFSPFLNSIGKCYNQRLDEEEKVPFIRALFIANSAHEKQKKKREQEKRDALDKQTN